MKKIQIMLIGLIGLMISGMASADNTDLSGGSNEITALMCDQLANDIDLVLTSGVVGTINCDGDDTIVGLSVCHTTGLTTQRSVTDQPKLGAGDSAACANGLTEQDDELCDGTVTGAAIPTATTAQGTVASRYPGTDCSQGTTGSAVGNAIAEAAEG